MKGPPGIYRRLIVPLGLTLLVAMLASWAIAVHLLTTTIDRRLDDQLDHATSILAEGEFPFSPELIARLDRLIEARIVLLDASGRIALSTTAGPANEALTDLLRTSGSGALAGLHTISTGHSTWRIAVRPLTLARDARFSYVAAVASLDTSRQAARDAAKLLAAAMLIVMFVLAWVGHYFTDLARQSRLAGLGEMSARIAHEIRNPLTAIKMQLQLLEQKNGDNDAGRIGKLLNEIRRMEMVVESALTQGAPLNLQRSVFGLESFMEDLADLLRPALRHRNIELDTFYSFAGQINADPDRLRQALINLINNAADELPNGGTIRVASTDERRAGVTPSGPALPLSISVEDTGPGTNKPRKASGGKPFGLGLGLTICREIVAAHGGELVSDKSPDLGGARFTIRLPETIIGSHDEAN